MGRLTGINKNEQDNKYTSALVPLNLVLINRRNGPRYHLDIALIASSFFFFNRGNTEGANSSSFVVVVVVVVVLCL